MQARATSDETAHAVQTGAATWSSSEGVGAGAGWTSIGASTAGLFRNASIVLWVLVHIHPSHSASVPIQVSETSSHRDRVGT